MLYDRVVAAQETLQPGELIAGRFQIQMFVARGGMGAVYRAEDLQTGQPVALKLLHADQPGIIERLAREAKALGELAHPAIVRYVAHEADAERGVYLAMEWLDGVTLSDRMRHQPLTADEALQLAARIADGLGAAHARGMVHRDVKPLNIFLVGGAIDRAKILDFGIVRIQRWTPITATGIGMGTPEYMAPEQARCDREIGPPADVFGLGCVLFKCLTGQTPFRGQRIEAILAKIAMADAPPRVSELQPEVPRAIDDLVARMMEPELDRRIKDGATAARAIRQVIEALRVGVEPTAQLVVPPSLTTSELQPIAVIFAALELAEADTVPSEVFDADMLPAVTDAAPTVERSLEQLRVMRGPTDAARVLPVLRRAVEPYGARVELLLNGSIVAKLSGGAAATDLATRTARCALAMRLVLPDASFGIATSRAVADDHRDVGPIIDAAAAQVHHGSRRIHIDKTTRDLLPERFLVYDDALAGERERAATAQEPPRLLLGKPTTCVGRNRLLRQLEAAFAGSVDDAAAEAFVVVGDAGVGKSRLRAELVARLQAAHPDMTVIAAWGDALRTKVPYGLIARALRDALDLSPATPAAELRARLTRHVAGADRARVADFLAELVDIPQPDDDSPALRAARSDPELMADHKRRAFEDWLRAECAAAPVLFVVDDLHWADSTSVDLLAAALRAARDLPLMLLAFGRPAVHDQFPSLGDDWARQEIVLDTLRPADCESLVREALPADVSDAIVKRIVDRSAGNAFYLEELIRAAAAGDTDALPESVLASVQLRIARLPDGARQVLRAASVFGRVFWSGGVRALLGADVLPDDIATWLAALDAEELVQRHPDTLFPGHAEYSFRHDLLRESAYKMLTDDDRMTGHRLAGTWLQSVGETAAIVLAEHFAGAGAAEQAISWFERAAEQALGDPDGKSSTQAIDALTKAATYYRRAGDLAAAAYANDMAITLLERAAALFGNFEPEQAAASLLLVARVLEQVGDPAAARSALDRAELYVGDRTDRQAVQLLLQRAHLERRASDEGALERANVLARHARDLASRLGAADLEAQALTATAIILGQQEDDEASQLAVQYAQLALSLQREAGDVAVGVWRLANAFLRRNELDRALPLYDQALAAAESFNDQALTAHCLANQGMVHFRACRLHEAIQNTEQASETYEHLGYRVRVREMLVNLGTFYQFTGRTQEATTLLQRAVDTSEGDWITATLSREGLAVVARSIGDERLAQKLLREAAQLVGRVGAPHKEAFYLGLLAESLWATGDFAEALDGLQRAVEVGSVVSLSHALIMHRMAQYQDAAEWLEHYGRTEPDPNYNVAAQLALARCLWWTGQAEEAHRVANDLRMRLPPELPRHRLPADILVHCLEGSTHEAATLLPRAKAACPHHVLGDVLVDLGTALADARSNPTPAYVHQYAGLAEAADDSGLRYRLLDLAARLNARIGENDRAVAQLAAARAAVDELASKMPPDFRAMFREHPWVSELRHRLV